MTQQKPEFSIIIATRNKSSELKECLKALCEQQVDKKCFEVIVVNDGGGTKSFDDAHPKRGEVNIRYFHLEQRKGPAAARNFGIERAEGRIILFLDDDSLPNNDWLDSTIRAWREFPEVVGIGGYVIKEDECSIYCRVNSDFFNWYLDEYSSDGYCTFLSTCNAGYKRDILNEIGGFDEHFKNASGEDRDLNIRLVKNGWKLRLDKTILVYHDKNLSFWTFAKKYYNYGIAAREVYAKHPEQEHLSAGDYVHLYISTLQKYRLIVEKISAFLLLIVSQTATALGYITPLFLIKDRR